MLKNALVGAIAVLYLGNGVLMLVDPALWYASVPGVTASGPMNSHFIRDIGFIYALSGAAYALALKQPLRFALWIGLGTLWPALHGAFHLAEWACHGLPPTLVLVSETLAVIVPVVVGIALFARARHAQI